MWDKPASLAWIFDRVPINASSVLIGCLLCRISCLSAALGFMTPFFSWLALLTGFYVLIVPECFGITDHFCDHLFWFGAILASSRCADVLSVDSLLSRVKGKTDRHSPPRSSWCYGLPLRVTWLLFGIIYFFPGFWKLWRCGSDWVFGNYVALFIYSRSIVGDPSLGPLIRIDQYQDLCKLSGLFTILFELSFIFLILFRRTRMFAVFMGVIFHCATFIFMGISFWALQACYVVFFDWSAILAKLHWFPGASANGLLRDTEPKSVTVRITARDLRANWLLLITCISLVLVNVTLGVKDNERFWPLSCYPTFSSMPPIERQALLMTVLDASGRPIPLDLDREMQRLYQCRRFSHTTRLLSIDDPKLRNEALTSLWYCLLKQAPVLKQSAEVTFYRQKVSMRPAFTETEQAHSALPEVLLHLSFKRDGNFPMLED